MLVFFTLYRVSGNDRRLRHRRHARAARAAAAAARAHGVRGSAPEAPPAPVHLEPDAEALAGALTAPARRQLAQQPHAEATLALFLLAREPRAAVTHLDAHQIGLQSREEDDPVAVRVHPGVLDGVGDQLRRQQGHGVADVFV